MTFSTAHSQTKLSPLVNFIHTIQWEPIIVYYNHFHCFILLSCSNPYNCEQNWYVMLVWHIFSNHHFHQVRGCTYIWIPATKVKLKVCAETLMAFIRTIWLTWKAVTSLWNREISEGCGERLPLAQNRYCRTTLILVMWVDSISFSHIHKDANHFRRLDALDDFHVWTSYVVSIILRILFQYVCSEASQS